ncbi:MULTISPECIES: hypothetical protein [Rhodomicrobium]|uniref:hypothetical protein n=1 Tax=Rhodomicrobium TaxID=1068 RepID=UPI000F7394F7|nr:MULTISPECIES: hypothetical protein [Rhodomicrobium]
MAKKAFQPGWTHRPDLHDGTADMTLKSEALVGFGFRCWLSGYQSGNIQAWENCWVHYCRELGSRRAREAMTDLSSWVHSVRSHAVRDIELMAPGCASFCRDERLAISLVAASQHHGCPALRACAVALLGSEQVEPVLRTAQHFAITLETAGIAFDASRRAEPPMPVAFN